MLQRALQIIDRTQQILDEILVAILERLLALFEAATTEVVELGLEAGVPVRYLLQLLAAALELVLDRLKLVREHLDRQLVGRRRAVFARPTVRDRLGRVA